MVPLDAWLDSARALAEAVLGQTHALAAFGAFTIVLVFVVVVTSWGDSR